MRFKGLAAAAGLGLGLGLLIHFSLIGLGGQLFLASEAKLTSAIRFSIETVEEGPPIIKIKDPRLQEGWVIVVDSGKAETWTALVRHQNTQERIFRRLKRQAWPRRMLVRVGVSHTPNALRIPQTSKVLKTLDMEATAYDPGPVSYSRGYVGLTSIGKRAQFGIIAVDPKVIPYRSMLYVEGYGPGLAADTGGDIKGNRLDLCFNSTREALKYGRRKTKAHLLGWVSTKERRRIRLALAED